MPILPDEALSKGMKAELLGLQLGDRVSLQVTGTYEMAKSADSGDIFSLPVKILKSSRPLQEGSKDTGSFGLNKTHAKMFVSVLKTRETADWVGVTFDALVSLGRNPRSSEQVLTWIVIKESITAKPQKK